MTFATAKFRSFLPAATFAMAAEFLMGMSDSVICGHVLGEAGLSAVNLMQGVFEIVTFVGMLVAVGTSVRFATEIGALHARRARGFFTLGCKASVALGLLVAAVLALVRTPVVAAFGASPEVSSLTSAYWLWYLPAAALQPVAFFLGMMCYTDGDARLSFVSYLVQLMGNCLLSIPLTMRFGAAGCAVGTGLGAFLAIAVLLFHFRKKGCMLGFSRHYVASDLLVIFRMSFGDASKNIGRAALMFALNAYVIAQFGSEMLPVLAVAVMTVGVSEIFDGVGNAVQPLASVYIGESNTFLTKRVMRLAMSAVAVEGLAAMALLLAFPDVMLLLAGVSDPAVVPDARLAVRLVSLALLGLAPGLSLVLFLLYLAAVGGRRRFPYLLPVGREDRLRVFDLELEPESVCATSSAVGEHLKAKGAGEWRATKAALLVEEALMVVRDRNAGRRVKAEVTVDLNDGLTLVLRDDGEIFDITDADARISSLRSYLVSNLMTAIPHRRNLTTTGFNRNVFKL